MTNAEIERLALLVEEAAEVQQIAMKILRHGYESYNPFDEEKTPNRQLLNEELGHLEYAIGLMKSSYDVSTVEIEVSKSAKSNSVGQYLHFNTP